MIDVLKSSLSQMLAPDYSSLGRKAGLTLADGSEDGEERI